MSSEFGFVSKQCSSKRRLILPEHDPPSSSSNPVEQSFPCSFENDCAVTSNSTNIYSDSDISNRTVLLESVYHALRAPSNAHAASSTFEVSSADFTSRSKSYFNLFNINPWFTETQNQQQYTHASKYDFTKVDQRLRCDPVSRSKEVVELDPTVKIDSRPSAGLDLEVRRQEGSGGESQNRFSGGPYYAMTASEEPSSANEVLLPGGNPDLTIPAVRPLSTSSAIPTEVDGVQQPVLLAEVHNNVTAEMLQNVPIEALRFRKLLDGDIEEIRVLHGEWFPLKYDNEFYERLGTGVLKKNLASKIFGYLARCEFWLKLGW